MKKKSSFIIGLKVAGGGYLIYLNLVTELNGIISIIYYVAGGLLLLGAIIDIRKINQNKS